MRPKTIRGWNIDEGAVAGHWASLTLALLGCGFFFRCYIRVACSHQTNCCRVHLEAAWGERSHTRFDWHVLTSPNEPPKKKRKLHPDSHTVNQAGLKVPVVHFQILFRLLSHLALSLFFFPPSLSLFSLSLLWISAHCATRKCTSRACQLHHGAFHLERPEPSVYQWNQPGI